MTQQLDRIEGKIDALDERMRRLEIARAKDDGKAEVVVEHGSRIRSVLHALIGPLVSAGLTAGGMHFIGGK